MALSSQNSLTTPQSAPPSGGPVSTIHNPTAFSLYCHHLDRSIAAGETITVSEEDARKVTTGVFEVNHPKPVPEAKPKRTAKHEPQVETR